MNSNDNSINVEFSYTEIQPREQCARFEREMRDGTEEHRRVEGPDNQQGAVSAGNEQ